MIRKICAAGAEIARQLVGRLDPRRVRWIADELLDIFAAQYRHLSHPCLAKAAPDQNEFAAPIFDCIAF